MVEFDPRFEIMPGTERGREVADVQPLEGDIGAAIPRTTGPHRGSGPHCTAA
jgi:hypothetical protein